MSNIEKLLPRCTFERSVPLLKDLRPSAFAREADCAASRRILVSGASEASEASAKRCLLSPLQHRQIRSYQHTWSATHFHSPSCIGRHDVHTSSSPPPIQRPQSAPQDLTRLHRLHISGFPTSSCSYHCSRIHNMQRQWGDLLQ
jgi:hypothetical protein